MQRCGLKKILAIRNCLFLIMIPLYPTDIYSIQVQPINHIYVKLKNLLSRFYVVSVLFLNPSSRLSNPSPTNSIFNEQQQNSKKIPGSFFWPGNHVFPPFKKKSDNSNFVSFPNTTLSIYYST